MSAYDVQAIMRNMLMNQNNPQNTPRAAQQLPPGPQTGPAQPSAAYGPSPGAPQQGSVASAGGLPSRGAFASQQQRQPMPQAPAPMTFTGPVGFPVGGGAPGAQFMRPYQNMGQQPMPQKQPMQARQPQNPMQEARGMVAQHQKMMRPAGAFGKGGV